MAHFKRGTSRLRGARRFVKGYTVRSRTRKRRQQEQLARVEMMTGSSGVEQHVEGVRVGGSIPPRSMELAV